MGEHAVDYNPYALNLVADKDGKPIGIATKWNPHGLGEVIVQYFDGSASSMLISELNFPNGKAFALRWLNRNDT